MLIGGTGGLMVGSLFDLYEIEETESALGRDFELSAAGSAPRSWRS